MRFTSYSKRVDGLTGNTSNLNSNNTSTLTKSVYVGHRLPANSAPYKVFEIDTGNDSTGSYYLTLDGVIFTNAEHSKLDIGYFVSDTEFSSNFFTIQNSLFVFYKTGNKISCYIPSQLADVYYGIKIEIVPITLRMGLYKLDIQADVNKQIIY